MAETIRDVHAERAAVIFVGGSVLVISLLFAALWAIAARARHLFKPEVTEQEIDALRRASRPKGGFYAGVTALAIPAPRVAALRVSADRGRCGPQSPRRRMGQREGEPMASQSSSPSVERSPVAV